MTMTTEVRPKMKRVRQVLLTEAQWKAVRWAVGNFTGGNWKDVNSRYQYARLCEAEQALRKARRFSVNAE